MKKRYYYLDLLKAFAIFSVCAYHFTFGVPNIAPGSFINAGAARRLIIRSLFSSCVPLFMMVNGALMLNKPFDTGVYYRKFISFLLQFFIWRALTYIILGKYYGVDFSAIGTMGLFNRFVLMQEFGSSLIPVDHFWFISAFIGIRFIFPFFKAVFDSESEKNSFIITGSTAFVLWTVYILINDYSNFKPFLPGFTAVFYPDTIASYLPFGGLFGAMLFYFLLGGIVQYYKDALCRINSVIYLIMLAAGIALSCGLWLLDHHIASFNWDNVFGGYRTTATVLISIALFFLAAKAESLYTKSKVLTAIISKTGSNTLNIFYLHWIAGVVFIRNISLPQGLLASLATSVLFVAVCVAVSELMKKIPSVRFLFITR